MHGSARSSSSPPPASPARVTDALAGLGVDDDPRAAIAGLIRATPKRERTSSAGSDDSNTAVTSPAASSAAAAAADVIARARAAALGNDAVWRTAEAAVDAVAAATRPATLEDKKGERTKRRDRLSAGDAAHVVARAASARAEHAAEVAAAAAAHAAAAAAFARARPGASADEEASAAARLADEAADAATRAAADATASAARAEQTSARVASLRLAELQGASVWDPHPHPHSQEASEGLPHTPPVMARGGVSNAADGDGTETPRGALPPSPTSAIRASELGVFRSGDFHSEPTRDPPALVRAPGSLGKPRRVPISEHDALLFDAAEAKLRLREGRRRAAAAFKDGALKDGVDGEGGADALELKLDANDAARADSKRVASSAVARALESAGAAPARRAERLPHGHGVFASRRAVDAMDRAAARTRARVVRFAEPPGSGRDATARASGEAAIAEDPGSPRAGTDANRASAANARGGKPTEADGRRGAPRRYDPGSFDVSLVNAHTRFHGEMNQTDKRLFQKDLRSARLAATRAAAAAAAGGGDGGGVGAGDASRRVGPRPTKKSRAAAAAAAERTRRAAEARAERIREAEAVVGSFAPFKASPAPSPAKPARLLPVRGAGTSVSPPPARRALPSGGASAEKRNASRAGGSPSASSPPMEKEKGSPSDSLVAARALLADLQSGVPVRLDEPFPHPAGAAAGAKSTWHELREAGRRSVARVRAYQSAEKASPPGATPAHERYQHYKMMGFGGMGAKTSWAR